MNLLSSCGEFETGMMCRYLFLTLLAFLLVVGCDNSKSGPTDAELDRIALTHKIELVEEEGGLALVIGGESITSDEIIGTHGELSGNLVIPKDHFAPLAQANDLNSFKTLAKADFEEVVTSKISNVLLVQHARRKAGPNVDGALDKMAEGELRKFVLGYGGNEAQADEELRKIGMDRKTYKEARKKRLLVDWYLQSQLTDTRPVTYRELRDAYNEMKERLVRDARITFRLIDIQPDLLEVPATVKDRGQFAREHAEKLVARLRAGEDFAELAKQYSHGHTRSDGGLWEWVEPEALAAPYNVLAAESEKIDAGQVAGPITVAGRLFIMKLEEKQVAGYAPFDDADVQRLVQRKVLSDRQRSAQGRLRATLREEARLEEADEFVDFCLEKIHTISRQPQSDAAGAAVNK